MTGSTLPPKMSTPQSGWQPSSSVIVGRQKLTLFVEAIPYVTSLLRDIEQATKRVWLETYIFLNDSAGEAVARALCEKARTGLDVRVLYDAVGSLSTPGEVFAEMERAGVKTHCFHSLGEALWKLSMLRVLNRRNHRKLVVIDDRLAYFGGMNIVDVSSSPAVKKAEPLQLSSGWRDVHVRLEGTQQTELAESFERSWRIARGEKVPRRPREYRRGDVTESRKNRILFFDTGPGLRYASAGRIFAQLMRKAKKRLVFSMAYFLPVGRVFRELLRAARRGVKVEIVVPADSDVRLVQYATRHLYTKMLKQGIQIYERQLNMLHSKMLIVDNEWALVGSANMDARSLWINLELIAVIRSRKMVKALEEIVKFEIAHSEGITLESYREPSWWRRLRNGAAWSLRWWL